MLKTFLKTSIVLIPIFFFNCAHAATIQKQPNNLGLVGYWPLNEGVGNSVGDFSGNKYTGTLSGTTSWTNGKRGKALTFDGATFVDMGSSMAGTWPGMTISAWVNPTSYNSWRAIVQTANSGDRALYLQSNHLQFYSACNSSGIVPLSTWTHVVVTVDGSDNLVYYINGANSGGCASASSPRVIEYLHISGVSTGDGENFISLIDDVRVYNRALSAAEVAYLYNSGAVKITNTSPGIDFTFENSTVAACPIGWTCTGDAVVASASDGQGCVIASNIQGTKYLKAGCDSTIGTADSKAFYLPPNISYVSFLRAGGADASTGSGLFVIRQSDGVTLCAAQTGTDTDTFFTDTCTGLASYARQKVFIRVKDNVNSGWGKTYVDNILFKNAAGGNLTPYTNQTNINHSQDSRSTTGLVGYWSFNGSDLTSTTATDVSGSGNNGTITGAKPTIGKVGQALSFNGSSGRVLTSSVTNIPSGGSARTFAVWIYPQGLGGVISGTNAASGQKYFVETGNVSGTWYLFTDGVNGSNNITVSGAELAPLNQWSHIVFTLDGSNNWVYYLNGKFVKGGTFPVAINTATPTSVIIGDRSDVGGYVFNGSIDEVRVYSRALSASEVQQLYLMGK